MYLYASHFAMLGGFFMLPCLGGFIMTILKISAFNYYIGQRLLLSLPELVITKKARIGLIGLNGSGKTTLLELLAQVKELPSDVLLTTSTTTAFLPQLKYNSTKSGGETTQEYILAALRKSPGLLFLDEPTNNLDFNHLQWLKSELTNFNGAILVVSHDRDLLDTVCSEIWSIENSKLKIYPGNYENYKRQKDIENTTADQAFLQYQAKKAHLEKAFLAKQQQAKKATDTTNISPSEARITGAKPYFAKKQKKLHKTGQALLTRLEQLEEVKKRPILTDIKLDLQDTKLWDGQILVRSQDYSYTYEHKELWSKSNFSVHRGEKVAIIGPNGCGKTTLLKEILKSKANYNPSLQVAKNSVLGYYSQNLDLLDDEKSILANLRSTSSQTETLLRTVLARLRFHSDDFLKPVKVLSGGERAKVALAKIFVSDANVLVLDEPTNHLDIDTVEALEELLQGYPGTIIFVSHDARLLTAVATKLLVFAEGVIQPFNGNYEEYSSRQQQKSESSAMQELLLIENKLAEIIGKLSIKPTEELDIEFKRLLAHKKALQK